MAGNKNIESLTDSEIITYDEETGKPIALPLELYLLYKTISSDKETAETNLLTLLSR